MPSASSSFPNGIDTTMGDYDPIIGLAMDNVQQWIQGYTGPASLSNVFAQTVPDELATATITPTGGVVQMAAIWLQAGRIVNNISVLCTAAASTPSHGWAGLAYPTVSPLCVCTSADTTTTAIAQDTVVTYAMSTAYSVATSGLYYAFWMAAATTTVASVAGSVTLSAHGRGNVLPILAGPGATGKSTVYAVGAAVTAPTAAAVGVLMYVN